MEEITTCDETTTVCTHCSRLLPSGGLSMDGPPTTLTVCTHGSRPLPSGGLSMDGPPTTLGGTDKVAFTEANITCDNTKFVNGAVCDNTKFVNGAVCDNTKFVNGAVSGGEECISGKPFISILIDVCLCGLGPPTTLGGTGIDKVAFAQANITRDNTKFVNGAVVGERDVFQLKPIEEAAGKPPPPILVLHGHYGGCVGDLPSYDAFTLGDPYSVGGYNMGELGNIIELAAELRVPVRNYRNTYVYAF